MDALIEADRLRKRFGKVTALDDLQLTLPAGQAVAILGPNGAGKTTFVRMVATLLQPDEGTLRVDGHDVVREAMTVRRMIGLAGQSAAVEAMMTGRENLVMVARLYGQSSQPGELSAGRILEQVSLTEAADRLVRTYSGGMRRRLDLGASLVGSPRLLLFDEPTTGLDPASRIEVWDGIRAMGNAGTDIILTTQYLDEADHLAASIVIIDGGRVIAQGTPAELKSRWAPTGSSSTRSTSPPWPAPPRSSTTLGLGEPVTDPATRRCSVAAPDGSKILPTVVRALDDAGVQVEDLGLRRPTLDEVFFALTGHATTEEEEGSMTIDSTSPSTPAARPETSRRPSTGVLPISWPPVKWPPGPSRSSSGTPALIIAGTAQGVLFLLIFRYVFGGAVAHTGGLSYVDFLVPGFVVTGVLFQGMGAASGVADDLEGGFFDRLRSLPIRLLSVVSGRVTADTALVAWGVVVMTAVGFLVGFRLEGGTGSGLAALGLTVLYGFAFVWVFITLGLLAGSPQAAQGLSFLVFPLSFVSSAYVPVATMPGWMQGFASHQPMTLMCNTVRILTGGTAAQHLLGHSLSYYLVPSLLWTGGIIVVFAPLAVWNLRRS